MRPEIAKLGVVQAVTDAVAIDADHRWVQHLPRIKKPGRSGQGRRPLTTATEFALAERTHDRIDAAVMTLCLDESDTIRDMYREGF